MTAGPLNFHSHDVDAPILTLTPEEYIAYTPRPGQWLTVGVHPWSTELNPDPDFGLLATALADPRVVALGEAGLDPLRGADISIQSTLLRSQLDLAAAMQKPVVFHIVRRYDDLLRLHHDLRPAEPWAVHGFRGKPAIAEQLARAGIYMSLGQHFNPDAARVIPDSLLLIETDDAPDSALPSVLQSVADARHTDPTALGALCRTNLRRFYPLPPLDPAHNP